MKKLFILMALPAAFHGYSQSLYNKGTLSIGASSVLYVKDSLVNNGMLINNGDMQVGGAWINNSQYDAGQGQITFNSDQPQFINHHDQSFSKLTISGGGEKIFPANITVENELNLSDGILKSENGAKIIISPGAQISGGSDAAHVVGTIYQKGTGRKLFPLGNGTEYLPLELSNVEGANAEVGVSVVELKGTVLNKSAGLEAISSKRYWQLDILSGSVSNSNVSLAVKDESIISSLESAVVAQAPSLVQNFESLGNASVSGNASNGTVTSNLFVSSKFLAVGKSSSDQSVFVYNAVSPNNDGLNDFLRIGNIESFPNNVVRIFNRWGDKVFEMHGYDNKDHVFRGLGNVGGGKELPAGTYYYVIDRNNGSDLVNGYFSMKN